MRSYSHSTNLKPPATTASPSSNNSKPPPATTENNRDSDNQTRTKSAPSRDRDVTYFFSTTVAIALAAQLNNDRLRDTKVL
jgi:hypothetical protein